MFIKCPECSKGYDVPESVITDDARKMRCVQCKTVFAVARRHTLPPPGFEHVPERESHLPPTYIFIRRPDAGPDDKEDERRETQGDGAGTEEAKVTDADPGSIDDAGDSADSDAGPADTPQDAGDEETEAEAPVAEQDDAADQTEAEAPVAEQDNEDENRTAEGSEPSPGYDEPDDADTEVDVPAHKPHSDDQSGDQPVTPPSDTSSSADQEAEISSDQSKEVDENDVTKVLPSAKKHSDPSRAPDFYGHQSISPWENETPLDLGEFSAESGVTPMAQLVGKIMFGVTVLVALLFLFVAFRNGWDLSFDKLGRQVSFAFSGKKLEKVPEELEGLEVTVAKSHVIKRPSKRNLLVTSGLVFNNTPFPKSHIVLRGQLFDNEGQLRKKLDFPCGQTLPESTLEQSKAATINRLYGEKDKKRNCAIGPEGMEKYQLILKLPKDYKDDFRIDVRPISAKLYR